MNLNINYYQILGVTFESTEKEIKKKYYSLSKTCHPDIGGNAEEFAIINEAYVVLTEQREEYDRKSKFGKDYNELEEFFKVDLDYNHKEAERVYDDVKKREVLDIIIQVDKDFDGSVEFARWVICPTCKGNGKDMSAKIQIKGIDGKPKWFEADDGCDFCEGTGKGWDGKDCGFCNGKGKVGINPCKKCSGEGRVLGKQKIKDIKLTGDETKIESMGNCSKDVAGMVGYLLLKKS
jgi:molecular chaperone DnaJ